MCQYFYSSPNTACVMKQLIFTLLVVATGIVSQGQILRVINTSPCDVYFKGFADNGVCSTFAVSGPTPLAAGTATAVGLPPLTNTWQWANVMCAGNFIVPCANNPLPTLACIQGVGEPCTGLSMTDCVHIDYCSPNPAPGCPSGTSVTITWGPGPGPGDKDLNIF